VVAFRLVAFGNRRNGRQAVSGFVRGERLGLTLRLLKLASYSSLIFANIAQVAF